MNPILITVIQILAFALFIYLIYPAVKSENWKEKFIENKHAKSMLIVFILIIGFMALMGLFIDTFLPVEVLK